MKKTVIMILSCLFLFHISLTVYAKNDETKAMFELLGVTYKETDAGVEFVVDENTPQISLEAREQFIQKYKNGQSVGDFSISLVKIDETGTYNIIISSSDGNAELFINNDTNIYISSNHTFFSLTYAESDNHSAISYCKGEMEISEYGANKYEEYRRNKNGEYLPYITSDGRTHYTYGMDGELRSSSDLKEGIIYDKNGNPEDQWITMSDGSKILVPYGSEEDVKAFVEKIGGIDSLFYVEDGVRWVSPEVTQYMTQWSYAKRLGLTVDDYQQKNEELNAYMESENVSCVNLNKKAEIYGVDRTNFFNDVEEIQVENYSDYLSTQGIMEEFNRLLNEFRVENGLEPLDTSDVRLQEVADIRAEESMYVMSCNHDRPFAGTASSFGIGENVMMIYGVYGSNEGIARQMLEGWMNSAGHRANMLNENWTQSSVSVKIAYINGSLTVIASDEFSGENYTQKVEQNETLQKRIALGAQTPDKYTSAADYYKALAGYITDKQMEEIKSNINTEDMGIVAGPGDLIVLDGNGDKFKLPNGLDWTQAWADFYIMEDWFYNAMTGESVSVQAGTLHILDEAGNVNHFYINPESIMDADSMVSVYFLNTFTGNTIAIVPSTYETLDTIFPGGYDASMWADSRVYYIANGDSFYVDFNNMAY